MIAVLLILAAALSCCAIIAVVAALLIAVAVGIGAAVAAGYTPVAVWIYARLLAKRNAANPLPPSQTYRPQPPAPDPLGMENSAAWETVRNATERRHARDGHTVPMPVGDTLVMAGVVEIGRRR